MKKGLPVVLAWVMVFLTVSCGPRAGEDVMVIISDAQGLAQAGNVDKALSRLTPFFKSSRYGRERPILLEAMVRIELNAGREAAALTRFKAAVTRQPEVAGPGLVTFEKYFVMKGRYPDLARWCGSLKGIPFAQDTQLGLAGVHLKAILFSGQMADVPGVFQGYLACLPEPGAVKLAHTYVSTLIRVRQWGLAGKLLEQIKAPGRDSPAWRSAYANETIDLLLARDGYKSAADEMKKMMKDLPDDCVARNVGVVGDAIYSAGDSPVADSLYRATLKTFQGGGHEGVRNIAANGWMKMATRGGKAGDLVKRLEEIHRMKVAPELVIQLIDGSYPQLLGASDRETFTSLLALCQALYHGELSQGDRIQVGGMMLDISFFLEDYTLSLKLIEAGAGGIREEQKPGLLAKVLAHLAMKNKQPREAARYFREFMAVIAKQGHDEIDPVSNCRVTPGMVLGLNAKRIGDLLMSAGDADEARKAYAEARGHYREALKTFADPASAENRRIIAALAEIPD